jgi:hypothetical protein
MGSTSWSIYAVDDDDPGLTVGGDPCDAVTLLEECIILVRRNVHRSKVAQLLVHEIAHAAIASSGLAVTQRWSDAREEVIVRQLATVMAHALVSGGLWRGRRIPR